MWMENVFAKKGFLARIAQKKNAIIIVNSVVLHKRIVHNV